MPGSNPPSLDAPSEPADVNADAAPSVASVGSPTNGAPDLVASAVGTAAQNLPPVAVKPDPLSEKESGVFEDTERHNLSVRKWAAILCVCVIVALYGAGLCLLFQSGIFARDLCTIVPVANAAQAPQPKASESHSAAASEAKKAQQAKPASSAASKAAMPASAASAPATSTTSCGNALAVLNSHAMVAALVALFSIPTVVLIILLRAFAPAKREDDAVPDTFASVLAEKLAAFIEKLLGNK